MNAGILGRLHHGGTRFVASVQLSGGRAEARPSSSSVVPKKVDEFPFIWPFVCILN